MTPKLPPLPEPKWWYTDDSGIAINMEFGLPQERPLFTADQLRSAQLATWKAAMECAAQECEARHVNTNYKYDTRYECAAAIRSLPLPE